MEISTPGRICLFGEHQDYLGLPIIAMAISLRSYIKGDKATNKQVTIRKPDLDHTESFFLDDLEYDNPRDYFKSGIKVCMNEGLSFPMDLTVKYQVKYLYSQVLVVHLL